MNKPLKTLFSCLPLAGLLLVSACSPSGNQANNSDQSNTANNAASPVANFSAAKGCKNVGVLLPESDSSARYEAYDRRY